MKKRNAEEKAFIEEQFIPVRINQDVCKGCGLCVVVCPRHLIEISALEVNKKGYHPAWFEDPEKACVYCAQCAVMCPDVAIEIVRLEEEI